MRSAIAATVASALVAGASAAHNGTMSAPMYTTEVVTAYTTYCPEPTTIAHNNITYTISEPTTFTITDCPCTVTAPIIVSTVTDCTSCPGSSTVLTSVATSPALVSQTPVAPVQPPVQPPIGTGPAPIFTNGTAPTAPPRPTTVGTDAASPTGPAASTTSPGVPLATGAANRAFVASGATLAGLVGLVAYAL